MRRRRLKPPEATWHHITARAAGSPKDRFFGDKEREKLRELLEELTVYYTVEVVAYNFMSNHLLCGAPHNKCYVKFGIM